MKNILMLIVVILLIWGCSGPKGVVSLEPNNGDVATVDSIEYELIVMDTGFETWYLLQDSPTHYRSQQYYEGWNRQYVSAWNAYANQPSRRSFFQSIIGYESNVDYGFELNHKLFYYFQYVEKVLKIPILPNSPMSVVF
ncbi:MAG TPA: hypothetical protein GX712_02745 [Bacteroidales bacterium]|nr:hypothetical protein [Bacteroidales bacterium]